MQQSRTIDTDGPQAGAGSPGGIAVGPSSRPTNFVAAALPDRDSYERSRAELIEAGVPADAIAVLQGETGAAVIADTRRRAHSWLDLGDERRYVERFEDEARQGHYVIGVPLPNDSDAMRRSVKSILAAHGGHAIVSGSRWLHEVVD